jgi:hypothetical protein
MNPHVRVIILKANWALYIDNYLEGFHIPYVHSSLNAVIDYGSYTSELYDYCNLQLAFAKTGKSVSASMKHHLIMEMRLRLLLVDISKYDA